MLALFRVCEAAPLYPSIGDDNMLLSSAIDCDLEAYKVSL